MMNDIEICSTALSMLGADEISTFQDETREAKLCNRIYETIVRSCLAERNWSFSQNQVQLNKLTAKPLFGFQSAFQLPSDYIRLAGKDGGVPHQIKEHYLYCDAEVIKVNYVFRVSEEKFPSHFSMYVIYSLCKILAVSLMEDENKSAYYEKQAFEQRKRAGLIDSQSNDLSALPLHNFSLYVIRI